MQEDQSDARAEKFRIEGSDYYLRNKFFSALVCYNISLCLAESNQMKSLAFANRSAVYIESKKYQHCLDNIKLAREHGYPEDKSSKLDAREVKCRELMEQHPADPCEDPWNFFKLSYPANKKLPFIVDCLELREDSKYGRHIVTNRYLKPGDIIAIEEPFFKYLEYSRSYERCSNCLKSNMYSLIPCKGRCVDTMFCSEECVTSAMPRHQQYECAKRIPAEFICIQKVVTDSVNIAGGIKELQACIEDPESSTIFDIDMTNPHDPQVKKKQLMALLSLMTLDKRPEEKRKLSVKVVEAMAKHKWQNLWETPQELELLVQTSQQLLQKSENNASAFQPPVFTKAESDPLHLGYTVSLFSRLFNHSCDANIVQFTVDNKYVAVVKIPINVGDQLFISYNDSCCYKPRDERRAMLLKDYEFNCDCNACRNDYCYSDSVRDPDRDVKKPPRFPLSSNPIEDFKKNCEILEKNFKNHPCRETVSLIIHNYQLVNRISGFGSFESQSVALD